MRHPVFLGLCAGVLGVLALRLPYGWPIIFVALIPLLYASQKTDSLLSAGATGACAGILISGTGSWWLFEALPLPVSYGVPNQLEGFALVALSWLIASAATGIWMGAWTAILFWMRLDRTWKFLAAGMLFLLSELASLYAYNVVTASPGVANPLFYSAGFVGYALADSSSFLQAAALGSVWTLSGIVVFVNLLLYFFLQQPKNLRDRNITMLAIVLILIASVPVASVREYFETKPTTPVRVGFMSLGLKIRDTPHTFIERSTLLVREALTHIKDAHADIALIPEEARVFAPAGELHAKDVLTDSDITIVHGGSVLQLNGRATLSGYASTAKEDTWLRNKIALVPQGEYLPSLFSGMLHLVGAGPAADRFSQTHALTNGEIGNAAVIGPVRATVLFCSEMLMPGLARRAVASQHANLLLIASSHSLFSGSGILEDDTLRFARVQTVEAGVPSVSSVTNGPAYAMDRYGRITTFITAKKNTVAVGIAYVLVTQQ